MAVYTINPLADPRWDPFLQTHERASIFHTPGWLQALHRTYDYSPLVVSTSAPGGDLKNGMVFCQVHSRLTGRRLVSLPFSDHCEPLVDNDEERNEIVDYLIWQRYEQKWRYIELRPLSDIWDRENDFEKGQQLYFHTLNLNSSCSSLFAHFHKESTQRKIRRAEREGLRYDEGQSDLLLKQFYDLLLVTRRRHRLPRQPFEWFHNLRDCFGEQLKVRVASKGKTPIASILTIRYKQTLVYKYGCSDATYHHLGGMHLLLWKTIQEGVSDGLRTLDLGRSDAESAGLITFKNRWGATCIPLTYLRYPFTSCSVASRVQKTPFVSWILGRIPDYVADRAGQFLYRHMG